MKIWQDEAYYKRISALEKFDHPGFVKATELCRDAKKILDVGCGDGSKLKKLGGKTTKRFGCDISPLAKKYEYEVFDGIHLPYKDANFDRVTSFFVLEHTDKPKELLIDMVRVLKNDGLLILLAPNFGAPNRASPNFNGSRLKKLFLNPQWHKVTPKVDSMKDFDSDMDTTMEPDLKTIVEYLQSLGMQIVEKNSFWEMEKSNAKFVQKVFRYFCTDWGPHLFIVARKLK